MCDTVRSVVDRQRIPSMRPPLRDPSQTARHTVEHRLARCLDGPPDLQGRGDDSRALLRTTQDRLEAGIASQDPDALLDVHRSLYAVYETLLGHPLAPAARHERSAWFNVFRAMCEDALLEADLASLEGSLPSAVEAGRPHYLRQWFLTASQQRSPLDRAVEDHLEHKATLKEMARFIQADGYLNYRFFDALVLAQTHFMEGVKQEIGHHLWDECGAGDDSAAHTVQFTQALRRLGTSLPLLPPWEDWRPYAGFNLYFMLGTNRRHHLKALGSLAMPELFDVDRDDIVVRGLQRLGLDPHDGFQFFVNHVSGDAEHGPEWLSHVVTPIVRHDPAAGMELAQGAALRMLAMRRYNEFLAGLLNVEPVQAVTGWT
ncbi:iron-containing redox enzyme family protein [Streptomyces mirabilis]|uniref:iron-containing redox enzyme family protein n=1 Tax=Streptomyces mirabilis TaxID=68239 RepID=UPI00364F1991